MGVRFRPVGVRFRPVGVRFRPMGLRFRPVGLRFRPEGLRFRPEGLRFRPQGLRSSVFVFRSSFFGLRFRHIRMFSLKEMLAGGALNKYHRREHSAWLGKYMINEKVALGGPSNLFFRLLNFPCHV